MYHDGDMEDLRLGRERWELIDGNTISTKVCLSLLIIFLWQVSAISRFLTECLPFFQVVRTPVRSAKSNGYLPNTFLLKWKEIAGYWFPSGILFLRFAGNNCLIDWKNHWMFKKHILHSPNYLQFQKPKSGPTHSFPKWKQLIETIDPGRRPQK
jgi:hypothetical protein